MRPGALPRLRDWVGAAFLVVATLACYDFYESSVPAWPWAEGRVDPALTGYWVWFDHDAEPSEEAEELAGEDFAYVVFLPFDGHSYYTAMRSLDGREIHHMRATTGTIAGRAYLQLRWFAGEKDGVPEFDPDEGFVDGQIFLGRYTIADDVLRIRFVDESLFEGPDVPAVDSPEALRAFLAAHVENPDLYGPDDEEFAFRRIRELPPWPPEGTGGGAAEAVEETEPEPDDPPVTEALQAPDTGPSASP